MADMLEEFHDQFAGEEIKDFGLTPWADPIWFRIAGTNTEASLLIDHRPGDTCRVVLEIDYGLDFWGYVRWMNLREMAGLMAGSLEARSPMPYSREYSLASQPDGEPSARHLNWKLDTGQ
ncbi:hypothetical protein ACWD01_09740 [Streptomyces sp. NPDC002835]